MLFIVVAFIKLVIVVFHVPDRSLDQVKTHIGPPKPPVMTEEDLRRAYRQRKDDSLTLVDVRKLRWRAGGFGSVAIATLSVESRLNFPIKDLSITCSFCGSSKTLINQAYKTVYDQINPKSTKDFRDLNFGFSDSQAQQASCRVSDFEYVVEPPR